MMAANDIGETIVIQCPQCLRVWVSRDRRHPRAQYGLCGVSPLAAEGDACRGRFECAPDGPVTDAVNAAYRIGGWAAILPIIELNPEWGWVQKART